MKADWTKTVEGVPLKIVRNMMRDLRRGHPTRERIAATTCEHIVKAGRRWSSDQVMPVRSSDDVDFILTELVPKGRLQIVIGDRVWSPAKIRRTGQAMTDALLAGGLLRPRQSEAREACYEVTDAGIGLACASVIKRIDRAQAERYVAKLLARADAINADADCLLSGEGDLGLWQLCQRRRRAGGHRSDGRPDARWFRGIPCARR